MSEDSGSAARKPTKPPARHTASKPSPRSGEPPARWAVPEPATVRASRPIATRLLACVGSGWRNTRMAKQKQKMGSTRAMKPNVPPTTECTHEAGTAIGAKSTPRRFHHSTAAISTASTSHTSAPPSRRCSGAMSVRSVPTRRTAAPTTCPAPDHAPTTARSAVVPAEGPAGVVRAGVFLPFLGDRAGALDRLVVFDERAGVVRDAIAPGYPDARRPVRSGDRTGRGVRAGRGGVRPPRPPARSWACDAVCGRPTSPRCGARSAAAGGRCGSCRSRSGRPRGPRPPWGGSR